MNELQTVDVEKITSVALKTTEARLAFLAKLMREADIKTFSMSRFGSGDSGDSAEFDAEMADGTHKTLKNALEAFSKHEDIISDIFEAFEARVESNYDNKGGRFSGEVTLVKTEDAHQLLCSARFFDLSEDQEDTKTVEHDRMSRNAFLRENLKSDQADKLIALLNSQDSILVAGYYGYGDEGNSVEFEEGAIDGPDGDFFIDALDKIVSYINSGYGNEEGGGGVFRFEPDGSLHYREFANVEVETEGESFDETYVLRGDEFTLVPNESNSEEMKSVEDADDDEEDQPRLRC